MDDEQQSDDGGRAVATQRAGPIQSRLSAARWSAPAAALLLIALAAFGSGVVGFGVLCLAIAVYFFLVPQKPTHAANEHVADPSEALSTKPAAARDDARRLLGIRWTRANFVLLALFGLWLGRLALHARQRDELLLTVVDRAWSFDTGWRCVDGLATYAPRSYGRSQDGSQSTLASWLMSIPTRLLQRRAYVDVYVTHANRYRLADVVTAFPEASVFVDLPDGSLECVSGPLKWRAQWGAFVLHLQDGFVLALLAGAVVFPLSRLGKMSERYHSRFVSLAVWLADLRNVRLYWPTVLLAVVAYAALRSEFIGLFVAAVVLAYLSVIHVLRRCGHAAPLIPRVLVSMASWLTDWRKSLMYLPAALMAVIAVCAFLSALPGVFVASVALFAYFVFVYPKRKPISRG